MKTIILGVAAAAAMAAPSAQADTILGLYLGADAWQAETTGGLATGSNLQDFDFEDKTFTNYYAALEHPIPLVPNVKVKYNQLELDGSFSGAFKFGDTEFGLNPEGNTTNADLSHVDYVLYYEIFDNSLFSIDLGVAAKQFDGDISVTGTAMVNGELGETTTETVDFSGLVPLGYAAAEVGLPLGFSAFFEGSLLAVGDSKIQDYQVGVAWEFVDNMAVDMAIKAGYRSMMLELDDVDDIYTDLETKGFFAGLQVHF